MRNIRFFIVMTLLLISPFCALAHHGSSGQFDTNQTYTVSGKITRIRLVNPHSYVYFDVIESEGEVTNMRCELQSGSLLKRRGWTTELFKTGSKISILGSPDRTDPTTCYMNKITFENGITATRNSIFNNDGTLATNLDTPSQEETIKPRLIKREDGTPNIDGNWAMVRERGAPPGAGGSSPVLLTDAGKAAVEGATDAENPRYQCKATNIIMDWWFDQMVNTIKQSDSHIDLTYGFMSLQRTIYLDGTQMPEDYVPSRSGFSTGEWQDNTLVVTTTGFDVGWIMAPMGGERRGPPKDRPKLAQEGSDTEDKRPVRPPKGRGGPPSPAKNSPELTIIEYFTLNKEGTELSRKYTITDPINLQAPITGADKVTFTTDAYEPYACDDLTTERQPEGSKMVNKPANDVTEKTNSQNSMPVLLWLEDSIVGKTISSTEWGYPIVLSLHALGMAILVGVALMLTFRVLGFASAIPVTAMASYWHIAQAGFVVNILSGAALFSGNAVELYFNWAFRIKIMLVIVGLLLTWWLVKMCIRRSEIISQAHIKLAAITSATWVAAIIAGRLIGYWS
ncbi:MAG: DUF6152 family protein [Paraglaciecola sp.]|uniref:DUF6152 family protein n=1 Tax=Paraglaciecola sp. TaxID=1920173 RepID=UPI0032670723